MRVSLIFLLIHSLTNCFAQNNVDVFYVSYESEVKNDGDLYSFKGKAPRFKLETVDEILFEVRLDDVPEPAELISVELINNVFYVYTHNIYKQTVYVSAVNFGGEIQFTKSIKSSMRPLDDSKDRKWISMDSLANTYILVGTNFSGGLQDISLRKYDRNFEEVWTRENLGDFNKIIVDKVFDNYDSTIAIGKMNAALSNTLIMFLNESDKAEYIVEYGNSDQIIGVSNSIIRRESSKLFDSNNIILNREGIPFYLKAERLKDKTYKFALAEMRSNKNITLSMDNVRGPIFDYSAIFIDGNEILLSYNITSDTEVTYGKKNNKKKKIRKNVLAHFDMDGNLIGIVNIDNDIDIKDHEILLPLYSAGEVLISKLSKKKLSSVKDVKIVVSNLKYDEKVEYPSTINEDNIYEKYAINVAKPICIIDTSFLYRIKKSKYVVLRVR